MSLDAVTLSAVAYLQLKFKIPIQGGPNRSLLTQGGAEATLTPTAGLSLQQDEQE